MPIQQKAVIVKDKLQGCHHYAYFLKTFSLTEASINKRIESQ